MISNVSGRILISYTSPHSYLQTALFFSHVDLYVRIELSHQQSREQIQWQRHRLAEQTASQRVAGTSAAALRTAAQISGAALSAAGSAAAAAAVGAKQGYHRLRAQGSAAANRSPVSDTAGLAEFGLDSASHPIDGLAGLGDARSVGAGPMGDAGASLLANEYEQGEHMYLSVMV